MPIADLTLVAGRRNVSTGQSSPDNGNNTFLHNWNLDPATLVEAGVVLEIRPLGNSVTTATAPAALSADGLSLTVNFTQTGADEVEIVATYDHSIIQ